jgi:hypothetical protein
MRQQTRTSVSVKFALAILSIATLALAFCQNCFALEPVVTHADQSAANVAPHIEALADLESALTISDVLLPETSQRYEPINASMLNFGIIDGTYWVRFQIHNTGNSPLEQYLEVEKATLDAVELYTVNGSSVDEHQIVRSDTAYNKRPVPARRPVFRISLGPGETKMYVMQIRTVGATSTNMTLLDPERYYERESHGVVAMGIYFGMLLIMTAHYLVMFVVFRETSFLYLAATIASSAAYVATYQGYTFEFMWPEAANLSQRFTLPLVGIMFGFSALFAERFLDAWKNSPKLAKVLIAIAVLGFCEPAVNAYGGVWSDALAYALGIGTPLAILVAALNCLRTGKRAAWIFLGSWSLLLVSAVLYSLADIRVIPDVFVIQNGPLLTFPVMLLMLSLAMWDRFKTNEERHRDTLEQRVEERTRELAKALEDVQTLEGLIPICAYCKKARDDAGFWSQIEQYISTRSNAEFSHGICPECLEKHYGDIVKGRKAQSPAGN